MSIVVVAWSIRAAICSAGVGGGEGGYRLDRLAAQLLGPVAREHEHLRFTKSRVEVGRVTQSANVSCGRRDGKSVAPARHGIFGDV